MAVLRQRCPTGEHQPSVRLQIVRRGCCGMLSPVRRRTSLPCARSRCRTRPARRSEQLRVAKQQRDLGASSLSATRCRATSSIGSEMSTATTRPRSPTARASGSVTAAVPQPISSRCSPPARHKRSSNNARLSWLRRSLKPWAATQRWARRPRSSTAAGRRSPPWLCPLPINWRADHDRGQARSHPAPPDGRPHQPRPF